MTREELFVQRMIDSLLMAERPKKRRKESGKVYCVDFARAIRERRAAAAAQDKNQRSKK
ncbi:MAG: hypothetical protein J5J00_11780 [Deltaproteobacteria bacterium]|nr:hypothetical protein [Deltaproteobacteria bacterium]